MEIGLRRTTNLWISGDKQLFSVSTTINNNTDQLVLAIGL